jgi:hypothetical protein
MKYFLLCLFFVNFAQAYTLNNNFGASFKNHKVKVLVDAGTVCDKSAITVTELESLISPAVDHFWNTVPTSKLRLDAAGFSENIFTMNHGRVCSPTDDACIAAANAAVDPAKRVIPAVTNIVIGCNDNLDNFGSENVLAVTVPNKFSGKKIVGAVILINNYSSSGQPTAVFGKLSTEGKIAVLAHEIGHAFGLGHSENSDALMYFRTVEKRVRLGQDDIDGVSYLYPKQFDLAGCGMITDGKNPPKDPPFWQMGITLGLLILIFETLKLLARSKTRTAA